MHSATRILARRTRSPIALAGLAIFASAAPGWAEDVSRAAPASQAPPLSGEPPGAEAPPELPPGLDPDQVEAQDKAVPEEGDTSWGLEFQLWLQHIYERPPPAQEHGAHADVGRLVLDFRHEWSLGKRWTLGFSNQWQGALDLLRTQDASSYSGALNNPRELWVRWQAGSEERPLYLDVGRINIRNGVGSGYSPTDFFKEGAVRQPLLLDPNAFRLNRLGTVVAMIQYIHESGAYTLALVPPLSSQDPMEIGPWYSPGLNRTNSQGALYAKWAPQIREWLSVDVLFLARESERPKLGLDLSLLLGQALVFNVDWAVGGCRPLGGPDEPVPGYTWCNRIAANLTWTTPVGIELTVEQQFASDALGAEAWRQWRGITNEKQLTLLDMSDRRAFESEPLLKHGSFARAGWRDAFAVRGLDLSSFVQVNNIDWSGLTQQMVTWHLKNDWSVGGQFLQFFGGPDSQYGSSPTALRFDLFVSKRY
ncbi:hypothetical protein [Hyalangium versicolor]|uniref:hypothetical protein n=1 Tax=Hyalangium versicolor TaxID=2861190 RepID=UPI001CCC3027|nr:hypothetical protein [Hyalangium versicolor]